MSLSPDSGRVRVRPARSSDVGPAADREARGFDTYPMGSQALRRSVQSPTRVFLVAEDSLAVRGHAVGLVRRASTGFTGRVYSVIVEPDARGRGIGRQLVEGLLHHFARRGVSRVFLEVEECNHAALALYRLLGFSVTRRLADFYGPHRHGSKMMLTLRPGGPRTPKEKTLA